MAVRASSTNAAFDALRLYKEQCLLTKTHLTREIAKLQQPAIGVYALRSLVWHFVQVIQLFDSYASTQGVLAAARTYENDAGYDVAAEHQAFRAALVSARNSLLPLFDRDAGGRPVYETMDTNGNMVEITRTAAQVAPVVTACQNVIALIA